MVIVNDAAGAHLVLLLAQRVDFVTRLRQQLLANRSATLA